MGKKRRAGRDHGSDAAGRRLTALLRRHPAGVHNLRAPAIALDTALPPSLLELYREFDGAELCHEAIVIRPSSQVAPLPATMPGLGDALCYRAGEVGGDDFAVDIRDRVFRLESDTDEWLPEGSDFARWLQGAIEAEILLYDGDGEFLDNAFEESGEPTAVTRERMCRRILDRDRAASAPRWRLARSLAQSGRLNEARDHLEQVVTQSPDFPWAWFDLARISESVGEGATAIEELTRAAVCRPDYEHAGFLFAHAARVAAALGDEHERARLAGEALARDPGIERAQRDGAVSTLERGEPEAALELAQLAAALAPRDLTVLDVLRRARAEVSGEEAKRPGPGE